jgi:hypothetical protein
MAIAPDATGGSRGTSTTSLTYSHTCTGSNLLLLVGGFLSAGDVITGVTYAGVSMTQLIKQITSVSSYGVYMYGLLAPNTGANNVVISASSSGVIDGSSTSYTGVKQTGLPDASIANDSVLTTITTTLTTITDNCWTALYSAGDRTPSASTGSTLRNSQSDGALFDSNGAITPAGSTSMTITRAVGGSNGQVMISFAPAGVVAPTVKSSPTLLTLMVG